MTAVFLAAVAALAFVLTRTPEYRQRINRIQDQLTVSVATDELQRWAGSCIHLAGRSGNPTPEIPAMLDVREFGLPTCLEVIDNNNQPYVYAHWGDGFGHWGLMIGNRDLMFPRNEGYYYIEWSPGIFIWHELQRRSDLTGSRSTMDQYTFNQSSR